MEPKVELGGQGAPGSMEVVPREHAQHGTAAAVRAVGDPVCGMEIDPASAVAADHEGTTYHFCSTGSRDTFLADPERYLPLVPRG